MDTEENSGDLSWLLKNFPSLVAGGYSPRFEALVSQHPPDGVNLDQWTGGDLTNLINLMQLESVLTPLKEQEFITEDLSEPTPLNEVHLEELDEILANCEENDREAFKAAFRYLKGEYTKVSLRA
mmetsp:Transcript_77/g.161  ORF Transcript_77/g.161 Transcript_77/m.161 type:complete len:125 (+) Transcript_77:96-470(+)